MPPPAAAPPENAAPSAVADAAPIRSGRPAWQRHPLFKFFASVKLAVVLLAVLIAASIAGTVYETSFDAKVARTYIYNAWWFDAWLTVLCLNLACAAFSRMPWKRHHTGFLITHLGIIILLVGAMIGRGWGIEGTMTIFKNQPPNNQLVVDQRVLRIEENGQSAQYPVNIIGRHPTPGAPWTLGRTPTGWNVELIDYAPLIDAAYEPRAVPPGVGGQPAVRVQLVTRRVGATLNNWLLAGDVEHGTLDLSGLASVQLRHGVAPDGGAAGTAPAQPAVSEAFVALSRSPEQGVAIPAPGSVPSGAKVRLTIDAAGKKTVTVDWRGATWDFDPDADRGKPQDLGGTGLNAVVEDYWPDFVMRDGKPATASAEARNPAVLVRVTGNLPAADSDDAAAAPSAPANPSPGAPPPMGAGTQAGNQAVIYCDDAGNLSYTLKSRAAPVPVRGTLKIGEPVATGWMDWQLRATAVIPAAMGRTTFHPVEDAPPTAPDGSGAAAVPPGSHAEGVRVRLSKDGASHEEWAAAGWQVTLPTAPQPTRLAYDFQIEPLPVGLQLQNFEVQFNEGTDNPSSFRSFVKVTDVDGTEAAGSCSMNHPFNYPCHWWNTFSGLTFKMSQASWSPTNLDQSTIQILRAPGWLCKWVGSLLVCTGIFTLFYLRPPRAPGAVKN